MASQSMRDSGAQRGAAAMRQTIDDLASAGAALAGSMRPRETCTIAIESSTVTTCRPARRTSRSVRPRHGRISACRPGSECDAVELGRDLHRERERCAAPRRSTSVSGVAATKLPPRRRTPRASPSRMRPDRVDGVVAVLGAAGRSRTRPRARRGTPPAASRRCPSCGRPGRWCGRAPGTGPAPGRPMLPRSSSEVDDLRIVATALRCWVRPIAQQTTCGRTPRTCVGHRARSAAAGSPVARQHGIPVEVARCARAGRRSRRCAVDEGVVDGVLARRAGRRPPGTGPGRRRAGSAGTGRPARCRARPGRAAVCGLLEARSARPRAAG